MKMRVSRQQRMPLLVSDPNDSLEHPRGAPDGVPRLLGEPVLPRVLLQLLQLLVDVDHDGAVHPG